MADIRPQIVKSAQRVLEVLEYFDHDRPTATVTDISRALSFPQSSTSELLRSLQRLGYLYYNRTNRTYRPTARVALLGAWVEPSFFRGGKVLAVTDRIADRLCETVALAVSGVDYAVHFIHVVPGTDKRSVSVHAGLRVPLLHCAQGELILASYPDRLIRLALHRLNADEAQPERRVNVSEKLKEMQAFREQGWIIRNDENGNGFGTISMLLPRRRGGDRIALSVFADCRKIEKEGENMLHAMLEERSQLVSAEQDTNCS